MKLARLSLNFLMIAVCLTFCVRGADAVMGPQPYLSWEGSFDYGVVGGTVLQDLCNVASKTSCDYSSRDGQGDTPVDWPNYAMMSGIPEGALIEKAYLIWMASNTPFVGVDNVVGFTPPNGDYFDIGVNPDEDCKILAYSKGLVPQNYVYFTCWANITDILRNHVESQRRPLNGQWTFGHLVVATDSQYLFTTGVLGAWGVIVVYQHPDIARKRLYLYKGFDRVQCGRIELNPSGFVVPPNPKAKVTFMVGEGDEPISGAGQCPAGNAYSEGLTFNGATLTDVCNPAGNQYNSTRNTNTPVSPCEKSVFSLDLDTYEVGYLLNAGQTSAIVYMDLGQDQIFSNFLMLSIDTKLPAFDIPGSPEKTSSVPEDGYVSPGDQFDFVIRVENWGEDEAHNVYVQDNIPQYTKYVCNSTYICGPGDRTFCDVNGANYLPVPDQPGCVPPFAGAGFPVSYNMPANGQNGGYSVKFKVYLQGEESGVTKETIIYNTAKIGSSDSGEAYVSNGGIPVRLNVRLRSYEGKLLLQPGEADPKGGVVYPGQKNVPITQVKMSSVDSDFLLMGLSFKAAGTVNDLAEIAKVRLYKDDGDGVPGINDQLIGESRYNIDDGVVGFGNFSMVVMQGQPIYLLLAYDMADNVQLGTWFNATIPDLNSLVYRGIVSPDALPYISGKFIVPATDLFVSNGPERPIAREDVQPGETFPIIQAVVKSATGKAYSLKGIKIDLGGNAQAVHIKNAAIILDANKNGIYDDGETKIAEGTFSTRSLQLTNPGGYLTVTNEAPLLILFAMSKDVTNYTSVKATISAMDFSDAQGGSVSPEGLPIESDMFVIRVNAVTDGDVDSDSADKEKIDQQYDWADGKNDGTGAKGGGGCAQGADTVAPILALMLAFAFFSGLFALTARKR